MRSRKKTEVQLEVGGNVEAAVLSPSPLAAIAVPIAIQTVDVRTDNPDRPADIGTVKVSTDWKAATEIAAVTAGTCRQERRHIRQGLGHEAPRPGEAILAASPFADRSLVSVSFRPFTWA